MLGVGEEALWRELGGLSIVLKDEQVGGVFDPLSYDRFSKGLESDILFVSEGVKGL